MDSRIYTVPIGAAIGGGILFGIGKACKAGTGAMIVLTIVGASIGGFGGFIR